MNKLLIGITGQTGSGGIAGCGKDTVADIISKYLGVPIYGFADPIYDMVKAGFGIDGKSLFWSDRKQKIARIPDLSAERDVSLRYLLETLGTEWGRNLICSNVWHTVAGLRLQESESGLIIRDVRFHNEVEWLDKMGGTLIHIMRLNYYTTEATQDHLSNQPLTVRQHDKVINNDSTLGVLKDRVVACLKSFL